MAGEVIGQLPRPGLVALVGIARDDDRSVVEKLARKTWDLRILSEERSCSDVDAPVLAVSQFTLYANCRKGRRPAGARLPPARSASRCSTPTSRPCARWERTSRLGVSVRRWQSSCATTDPSPSCWTVPNWPDGGRIGLTGGRIGLTGAEFA